MPASLSPSIGSEAYSRGRGDAMGYGVHPAHDAVMSLGFALVPGREPADRREDDAEIDNAENERDDRVPEIAMGLDMRNGDDRQEGHRREVHEKREPAHDLAVHDGQHDPEEIDAARGSQR